MANLFWEHPDGDTVTIPCVHLVQQHPGGDTELVPCTHSVPAHPGGHTTPVGTVPCGHLVPAHPAGDAVIHPCTHLVAQHPGGHPAAGGPCVHPLTPVRVDTDLNLVFYTDDATLQDAALAGAARLRALGVEIGRPRPLNVFARPPLRGNPDDAQDPFWSHYDPGTHSIQVTWRTPADYPRLIDTLYHEMGHALLGHRCVQIATANGPHTLTQPSTPGVALSEGWAHLVALAIRFRPDETPTSYKGMDWEERTSTVPLDPNIEYNVACALWDLLDLGSGAADTVTIQIGSRVIALRERVTMPFADLFRVYSPSLATLADGPIIPDVQNYLMRLSQNHPGRAWGISIAARANLG